MLNSLNFRNFMNSTNSRLLLVCQAGLLKPLKSGIWSIRTSSEPQILRMPNFEIQTLRSKRSQIRSPNPSRFESLQLRNHQPHFWTMQTWPISTGFNASNWFKLNLNYWGLTRSSESEALIVPIETSNGRRSFSKWPFLMFLNHFRWSLMFLNVL